MERGPKARREFCAGDNIYYQTNNPLNRSAANWSPGLVMSRESNKTYKIHADNGDVIFRHEDHVKGRCEAEVHLNDLSSDSIQHSLSRSREIRYSLPPPSSTASTSQALPLSANTPTSSADTFTSHTRSSLMNNNTFRCYNCDAIGHFANRCPHPKRRTN